MTTSSARSLQSHSLEQGPLRALESTTVVAQAAASAANETARSRSSEPSDAPYLAATAQGVSQSASSTGSERRIDCSATTSRRKAKSWVYGMSTPEVTSTALIAFSICSAERVEANDLVRLYGVSRQRAGGTQVRASGLEQPTRLF